MPTESSFADFVGDRGPVIGGSGFVDDPATGVVGGYRRWAGQPRTASTRVFRTNMMVTLAAGNGPLGTCLMLIGI